MMHRAQNGFLTSTPGRRAVGPRSDAAGSPCFYPYEMGFPDTPSSPQAEECKLPWSHRVPVAIGLFAFAVGGLMAAQRHQFTHPNWNLLLILVVIGHFGSERGMAPLTDPWDRARALPI
jgi:hypothetical protein